MVYDSVVCVGPQHREIAGRAIRALSVFAKPEKIFVVAPRKLFPLLQHDLGSSPLLRLIDEDTLLPGITMAVVQDRLRRRIGSHKRAAWYFQQFLKMSISRSSEIADFYLIWDSDSILLQPLEFFRGSQTLVNPRAECHEPYFKTMKKLLHLDRQVDFSFISEHMMVKTSFMRELLDEMSGAGAGRGNWAGRVLDHIEPAELGGAGFSEYETYGNYVARKYPGGMQCRPLKSLRAGAAYYGLHPDKYDLVRLMRLGHVYASFELHQRAGNLTVLKNKALSRVRCLYYRQTKAGRDWLRKANIICGGDML